ncbi:MAG: type II secretion system F family protein [Deltaproteobacteria bacterium]|nr:type II secretion system F family protein [Deltaproteobacteria bacterium]
MNSVALVVLFIAALALAQVAVWASGRQTTGHARLRSRHDGDPEWDREPPLSNNPSLSEVLETLPGMLALQRLQAQAGNHMTATTFVFASLGLAIAAQVGTWIAGAPVLAGALMGLAGAAAPFIYLFRAKRIRARRITDDLPRALRALSRLANAGQGPAQAIRETALELQGPLARELGRAFAEQRDGRPLRQALEAMTDRVPDSVDLRILIVALVLSTEAGGDLGGLLERIETTLSSRIALAQKARAQQAQARLAAGILAAMPPLGVLGVALVQPDHFMEGWADPLGKVLYLSAGAWMTVGMVVVLLLLRRIR